MPTTPDDSTGLVGGTLDLSQDTTIDERSSPVIDAALARRHQAQRRADAAERLQRARRAARFTGGEKPRSPRQQLVAGNANLAAPTQEANPNPESAMSSLQPASMNPAPSRVVVALQWSNHALITLFAIASGIYKVVGGAADVQLYGAAGIGVAAMAALGAAQALGGLALLSARSRKAGAAAVMLTNGVASGVLFVNHVQPFGYISLLFVAMAALELRFRPAA